MGGRRTRSQREKGAGSCFPLFIGRSGKAASKDEEAEEDKEKKRRMGGRKRRWEEERRA